MSTKSNQVFLNQIFDEAVSFISDAFDASSKHLQSPQSKGVQSNYCSSGTVNNNIKGLHNTNCVTTTDCVITTGGVSAGHYQYTPYQQEPLIYYNTPITYGPIIWVDVLRDFTSSYSKDSSHPVTNFSVDKDGNFLVEIACTGFEADELTVERKDLKIIVEGKRKNKETTEDRKYFYRNIATRDFSREFIGSEKWCFDKLSVSYKDGLLSISIPLKDEFQPVRQKYEIK